MPTLTRSRSVLTQTVSAALLLWLCATAPAHCAKDSGDVSFTQGLGIPGFVQDKPGEPVDPLHVLTPQGPKQPADPNAVTNDDPLDETAASDALQLLLTNQPPADGAVITLDEATALALEHNPRLVTLAQEVDARFAQVLQAAQKPVPELDISLSEFMGQNDRRQLRHSVSEVTYSKLLERLDKRIARQRVARLGGDLAHWDYEAAVRDIQLDVSRRYVTVLVAQKRLQVANELLEIVQALRNAVSLRLEAGTVSELELTHIDIELSNAKINAEQAQSDLDAARKNLSALWGDITPDFVAVDGAINDTPLPPDVEKLLGFLPDNPLLARYATEALERQARLDLAYQEDKPEYTVRGGVQGFADTGEMALTLGVTIPTKKRNLNPGGIREAQIRMEQLQAQHEEVQRDLQAQLVDAVSRLQRAYDRATRLLSDVIPAARRNLDDTVVGYRYGKFSYLDVLESERTLVESVSAYIDSLAEYQAARVEVERLIGQPLRRVAGQAESLAVSVTTAAGETAGQPTQSMDANTTQESTTDDTDTNTTVLEGGNG